MFALWFLCRVPFLCSADPCISTALLQFALYALPQWSSDRFSRSAGVFLFYPFGKAFLFFFVVYLLGLLFDSDAVQKYASTTTLDQRRNLVKRRPIERAAGKA